MSASSSPASSSAIDRHIWRIAIVVILGSIMSVLDTTVVNVALEPLSRDLHVTLDDIQWVATGYLLSLAAIIPVTGWAGKRFGARTVFISALVLFTLGSALCGLASSAGSLIAFRVLQGIGGGMLTPMGQIILVRATPREKLPRVMSAIGVPIVLAPIFGPTLGGLLIEHVSWQSIFLINVPIGILTFVAAWKLLPKDAPEGAERLDLIGLILVAVGVVGVTYGLAESGSAGTLASSHVLVPLIVGLVLVAAFVVRALRIPFPLLDVRLYANRAFSAASITTFCLGGALFGAMILMPLYFQIVRGEDAVHTGLLLIPQGIGAALAMHVSGRSVERWGGGITAFVGGALTLVATVPFLLLTGETSFWLIGVAMVFRGFGIGMSIMPAMTAAFTVLRPDQVSDATPQLTTLMRVGGSIGTAILTVILQNQLTSAGPQASADAMANGFNVAFAWVMGITLVALLPTILLIVAERRARNEQLDPESQATAEELTMEAA
jgi:EmrB/QacA subfamily drug resistance transporter